MKFYVQPKGFFHCEKNIYQMKNIWTAQSKAVRPFGLFSNKRVQLLFYVIATNFQGIHFQVFMNSTEIVKCCRSLLWDKIYDRCFVRFQNWCTKCLRMLIVCASKHWLADIGTNFSEATETKPVRQKRTDQSMGHFHLILKKKYSKRNNVDSRIMARIVQDASSDLFWCYIRYFFFLFPISYFH